jgi:orotidine-5'-phosphate decarboxylase
MAAKDHIIIALDQGDWASAQKVAKAVQPYVGMAKLNSLALRDGWQQSIQRLDNMGTLTMADAKFHETPATAQAEVAAVASCGARLITVHASGGLRMLQASVAGRDAGLQAVEPDWAASHPGQPCQLLAITVLTSLGSDECESMYGTNPQKKVIQFAHLALEAGVDGIVCSGQELRALRGIAAFDKLQLVVPGIVPDWAEKPSGQQRIVTPAEALREGADYIVIGRSITQPPAGMTCAEVAARIADEVTTVLQ